MLDKIKIGEKLKLALVFTGANLINLKLVYYNFYGNFKSVSHVLLKPIFIRTALNMFWGSFLFSDMISDFIADNNLL